MRVIRRLDIGQARCGWGYNDVLPLLNAWSSMRPSIQYRGKDGLMFITRYGRSRPASEAISPQRRSRRSAVETTTDRVAKLATCIQHPRGILGNADTICALRLSARI